MRNLPKTKKKPNERIKYTSVQIPVDIINLIREIIPPLYRNHHEFILESIRQKIERIVDLQYKLRGDTR